MQQQVGDNLTVEVNGTGSLGRRLITTDIVNRQFTTTTGFDGRPNEALPDVSVAIRVRDFPITTRSARWCGTGCARCSCRRAYTWSHSIDNQSDPLVGDFFDLNFTPINNARRTAAVVFRAAVRQQWRSRKFGLRSAA